MNRITRSIASICAPFLLMAGCSADHANAPGAMALLAPSPMDMKAEAPIPTPSTSGWVAGLSNPYLGFEAGRVFNYRSETPEGIETTVVEVTSDTRLIQGVVTTVVHDRVSLDGSLIEDTFDWYAQDADGTVWYFGEDSKQVDHGVVVGTEGSWEAGVNGAQAGIAMLADPKVGVRYSQEYSAGVAEDMARIQTLAPARCGLQRLRLHGDARVDSAGQEGARVQVLRTRRRPGADDRRPALRTSWYP